MVLVGGGATDGGEEIVVGEEVTEGDAEPTAEGELVVGTEEVGDADVWLLFGDGDVVGVFGEIPGESVVEHNGCSKMHITPPLLHSGTLTQDSFAASPGFPVKSM